MHHFPKLLKDWKTADYKAAQTVCWAAHGLLQRPNLFATEALQDLAPSLKQIGDAFAEQIHYDRHGCTIGTYTG